MYDSDARKEHAPEKAFNQLGVLSAAPTLYEVAPPNQSLASAHVSADFTRCNMSEPILKKCASPDHPRRRDQTKLTQLTDSKDANMHS